MKYCKKCKGRVYNQTIVKYKDSGNFKIVGKEEFCTNMNCDYQRDIK